MSSTTSTLPSLTTHLYLNTNDVWQNIHTISGLKERMNDFTSIGKNVHLTLTTPVIYHGLHLIVHMAQVRQSYAIICDVVNTCFQWSLRTLKACASGKAIHHLGHIPEAVFRTGDSITFETMACKTLIFIRELFTLYESESQLQCALLACEKSNFRIQQHELLF